MLGVVAGLEGDDDCGPVRVTEFPVAALGGRKGESSTLASGAEKEDRALDVTAQISHEARKPGVAVGRMDPGFALDDPCVAYAFGSFANNSRASFIASAICSGVIEPSAVDRPRSAVSIPTAAATLNHA